MQKSFLTAEAYDFDKGSPVTIIADFHREDLPMSYDDIADCEDRGLADRLKIFY